MTPFEAILSALFGIFRYGGRAERLEQWSFTLFTAIAALVGALAYRNGVQPQGMAAPGVLAVCLWFLLAHVALLVRRLHDHGRTGFYLFIPLLGAALLVIGHLGDRGQVDFFTAFLDQYGWYIERAGRTICTVSVFMVVSIFAGPGDDDENRFGDPP